MLKKILLGLVGLVVLAVAAGAAWAMPKISAYDESIAKKYDFPLEPVTLTTDPEALARGKHLTEAIGACVVCHGANLAGGKVEEMGPVGKVVHVNITSGKGGRLSEYSDAELMRLLRHGVKRDGTTARLMPVQEFSWWPVADRVAVISYLHTVPPVDGQPAIVEFSAMAKVLDRIDSIPIDVARRIDHQEAPATVAPAATAEYGALLARGCGCHGPNMSGGPIPGAPPDFGIPHNLTPHETGTKGWTYERFTKTITTGVSADGRKLSAFMPSESFKNMSELELKALWAHIQVQKPVPTGQR